MAIRIFKRLSELLDVDTSGVSDGDALTYDTATSKWIPGAGGGGGGAPTDADYLVGTANGSLSAEIVVGTSPGGELGGTWASPTVDATHSGSSHASVQAAAEATAAAALLAHTTDSADAHDASAISIADAANDFTATDVEGALAELQSDHETDAQNLADHIADSTAAHAASAVSVNSTSLSGTGTDVQAAFEEIDNLLDDHSARHENGGADEISLAGLDGTPTELTNHLNDTSAAHAASAISADSTTLVGTGTDVQAVLEELDNAIADHLADTADAHDASAVSVADAGGYYTATEVEAVLQEIGPQLGGSGPGTELDYAEVTSNVSVTATSEASPTNVVSGAAISLDGSTEIIVECYAASLATGASAGSAVVVNLWDGSTDLGRIGQVQSPAAGVFFAPLLGRRLLTPSNGSHTYHFKAWRVTANGTVYCGAGGVGAYMPAYIRVTRA